MTGDVISAVQRTLQTPRRGCLCVGSALAQQTLRIATSAVQRGNVRGGTGVRLGNRGIERAQSVGAATIGPVNRWRDQRSTLAAVATSAHHIDTNAAGHPRPTGWTTKAGGRPPWESHARLSKAVIGRASPKKPLHTGSFWHKRTANGTVLARHMRRPYRQRQLPPTFPRPGRSRCLLRRRAGAVAGQARAERATPSTGSDGGSGRGSKAARIGAGASPLWSWSAGVGWNITEQAGGAYAPQPPFKEWGTRSVPRSAP